MRDIYTHSDFGIFHRMKEFRAVESISAFLKCAENELLQEIQVYDEIVNIWFMHGANNKSK